MQSKTGLIYLLVNSVGRADWSLELEVEWGAGWAELARTQLDCVAGETELSWAERLVVNFPRLL